MKLLALSLIILFALPASAATSGKSAFSTTVTAEEIVQKYTDAGAGGENVKVLIMPGHEPTYGGTQDGALKERDIAVDIAEKLAAHLRTDSRLEVTVARDTESWLPALAQYFKKEWKGIKKFVATHKKEMNKLVSKNEVTDRNFEVVHNSAPDDVAYRLYGITKWANENEYDLVIHIHLNDNPGAQFQSGYAVYIPDSQFGNAAASRPLGQSIMDEFEHFNTSSTLPIETYGLVEDQDLIALGAFNTADFASVLIEYAYIYESKIRYAGARDSVLTDMAWQTYRGVEAFVGGTLPKNDTRALPYTWTTTSIKNGDSSPQIYALQVALHKLGFYPPAGELLVGCPVSGYAGACTVSALKAFQKSKGLEQTGSLGPRTIAALKKAGF